MTLGAAVAVTSTIRLGTAVAIPVESDPITLAKTIASVDHLAGGRTVLGVGYGWNLDEMADHNVPPVIVGAGGTDKNFRWISRHADGWMTTPIEQNVDEAVGRPRAAWRDGAPVVNILDFKPDKEKSSRWRDVGVDEVVYGTPDKSEEEVAVYIERLAGKLDLL